MLCGVDTLDPEAGRAAVALGGSAATLFSQVPRFSSTRRLYQLRPLARLGVYARPLRHCGIPVPLPQKSHLLPSGPW